ncbi:hypothetical protein EV702DRAFT_1144625, partial [Suillus placidus]
MGLALTPDRRSTWLFILICPLLINNSSIHAPFCLNPVRSKHLTSIDLLAASLLSFLQVFVVVGGDTGPTLRHSSQSISRGPALASL